MTGRFDGRPVVPASGRLRPLGIDEVEVTGGFWGDRQEVNSSATIAHCHDWNHHWANRGPSTMRVWIPTVG